MTPRRRQQVSSYWITASSSRAKSVQTDVDSPVPYPAVREPALPSRGAAPLCLRPATGPTTAASSSNRLSPEN